jgi:hypothetical protein
VKRKVFKRIEFRGGVARGLAFLCVAGSLGCAKNIPFDASPLAHGGSAQAKVELTYDRNNTLEVKLSNVAEPSTLKPEYRRYVLWASTPDRKNVSNIGQIRVDEKRKAEIKTLTPLRRFILFITAETSGDAITPGPDIVFRTDTIDW